MLRDNTSEILCLCNAFQITNNSLYSCEHRKSVSYYNYLYTYYYHWEIYKTNSLQIIVFFGFLHRTVGECPALLKIVAPPSSTCLNWFKGALKWYRGSKVLVTQNGLEKFDITQPQKWGEATAVQLPRPPQTNTFYPVSRQHLPKLIQSPCR